MSLRLEEQETLLRAIFDDPQQDLPRLVYADWLEERDEVDRAELIRLECSSGPPVPLSVRLPLLQRIYGTERAEEHASHYRGFWKCDRVSVAVSDLLDLEAFRRLAVNQHPEWFGATTLAIHEGRITESTPFETIYQSPSLRRVRRLELKGLFDEVEAVSGIPELDAFPMVQIRAVITNSGVDALAQHRLAGRIEELILTNNELGNDALRWLARSPYFGQLQMLEIREGHSFRGSVWAQLISRFGEDVVC